MIRDSGSGELIVRSGEGFRERRGWATKFCISVGKIGEREGRAGELWRRAIARRFVVTEEEMEKSKICSGKDGCAELGMEVEISGEGRSGKGSWLRRRGWRNRKWQ